MTPTPTPWYGFLSTNDPLINILIAIIEALLVLLITLVLARVARRWIVRLFTRSRVSLNVATLMGNLVQVMLVVLGALLVLHFFGIDWAGLVAVVGAAGLAISLSLQDILKNVFAGIYLLLEQPFNIGDRISVKEVTGTVQGIELRTTIIRTDEDLQVIVPNNTVLTEILTNRSAANMQRQIIHLTTKNSGLSNMSTEIRANLKEFPEIAKAPAPVVALEEATEESARLRVEFWVRMGESLRVTPRVVETLQGLFPSATITIL